MPERLGVRDTIERAQVRLTAAERAWLKRFCPSMKAQAKSCLEVSPHTLCQACFTHGSVRAILADRDGATASKGAADRG